MDALKAAQGKGRRPPPEAVAKGSPRRIGQDARGSYASAPSASSSCSPAKGSMSRLLDHRTQSVSTFASSAQSMGLGSALSSKAWWSEEMPSPILFPTNKPSSRADATILNHWITNVLDRYAERMAGGHEQTTTLTQMVDELVPILSIGLHELTRQVSQQCAERGVVLEKIWRTYVELFDRALAETRAMVRFHKTRTQRVVEELSHTSDDLTEVKQKHPEQLQKLSSTLSKKFVQRQEELDGLLKSVKHENTIMQQLIDEHRNSLKAWFPLFDKYKNSPYHITLKTACPELPSTTTPESRIAADFKRILVAMPNEARRRVGFFVSSLLGLRGTELVENPETIESLTERKDHNSWKIGLLEQRIKELKGEAVPEKVSKRQAL